MAFDNNNTETQNLMDSRISLATTNKYHLLGKDLKITIEVGGKPICIASGVVKNDTNFDDIVVAVDEFLIESIADKHKELSNQLENLDETDSEYKEVKDEFNSIEEFFDKIK